MDFEPLIELRRNATPECLHMGALAIKVMDGNMAAFFAATACALDQLGWLDGAQRQVLLNVAGVPVGERRSLFRLRTGAVAGA